MSIRKKQIERIKAFFILGYWFPKTPEKAIKERTLVEGIHGTWHYHLSDDGKTALCGAQVMISEAPESTWGYVGHLHERYCSKCSKIREPNK